MRAFDQLPPVPGALRLTLLTVRLLRGTAVAGRCDAMVTGAKDLLDLVRCRDIAVSPRGFWSFESRGRSGG